MQRLVDTNHATLTDPRDGSTTITGSLYYDDDADIVYVFPWAKPRSGGGGDPHQHGGITVLGLGLSVMEGDCNLPDGFNCKEKEGKWQLT